MAGRPAAGWQWLKTKLLDWDATASLNPATFGRPGVAAGCLARATGLRVVHLQDSEVLRLTKDSGCRRIEVRTGTLWLTGTPATGDVLLRPGEQFHLTHHWPFVLQAVTETQIVLRA
jgi:hypothetical protein